MRQTLVYVLSETDADRLYNLTRALAAALGDLLSARQQAIEADDYDHHELSVYELEHLIRSSTESNATTMEKVWTPTKPD